jgi:hypothetical protein
MYMAGASTSYRVGRSVHLVGQADQRYYDLSRAGGHPARKSYLVLIGLAFAPGDVPSSLR